MIVTALFGPIISLLNQVKSLLGCLTSAAPTPGGLAAVGALGAAAGAGFDSQAILDEVQGAREEKSAEDGKRDENGRERSVQYSATSASRGPQASSGPNLGQLIYSGGHTGASFANQPGHCGLDVSDLRTQANGGLVFSMGNQGAGYPHRAAYLYTV